MMNRRFGLLGHPVEHSMSAVMHNAVFKKLNLPYSYELFDVLEEDLGSFMAKTSDFYGMNVTIPYKVKVISFLDGLSKEAKLISAVNTIKIDGRKIGYNTDGIGCVRALEENNVKVKGSRVLVLGAGGASRAIVFRLALEGAKVSIFNRTRSKALELAGEVKRKTKNGVDVASDLDLTNVDVLINATSVGMHPKVDETPVEKSLLCPNLVVMDLVYNPVKTRLLSESEKAGCKTIDGVGMLVNQGAESLRVWLDIKPPIDVMRDAVVKELST